MQRFKNRTAAGQLLAQALTPYENEPHLVVLALPRGGVPVAFEVAKTLRAALDVFLVRKLGVPGQRELAMGAVSQGGRRVLNPEIVRTFGLSAAVIDRVTEEETVAIKRQEALYRQGQGPLDLKNQTVIVVDDGVATGATMLTALHALRARDPQLAIVAVPVSPPAVYEELRRQSDHSVCLLTPEPFYNVGRWYEDFSQTRDEDVIRLLQEARSWRQQWAAPTTPD